MTDNVKHVAAGALFLAKTTGRVLLNLRSKYTSNSRTWSFCGGMVESNETVQEGLARELYEEIGSVPNFIKSYPLDVFHSADGNFNYFTLLILVEDEFIPKLNRESDGYAWVKVGAWPAPLHPAAKKLLHNKNIKKNILWTLKENTN